MLQYLKICIIIDVVARTTFSGDWESLVNPPGLGPGKHRFKSCISDLTKVNIEDTENSNVTNRYRMEGRIINWGK